MGKTPSHIGAQVRTLMQTKGITVKQMAEESGVHRSRISGFLTEANGISGVSLMAILKVVGIEIDTIVQQAIANTINGETEAKSLGTDIGVVVENLPPIEQKLLLSTLLRKAHSSYAEGIDEELERLSDYKNKITFQRRGAC